MAGSFLLSLVKRIRQIGFSLSEKPSVEVEDYTLEHFYLYHGLAGTSPENKRSFKDVRVDIKDAVEAENSNQLGIALKLQPLYWSDKLKQIASEFPRDKKLEKTLLPDMSKLPDQGWPSDSDPLGHTDWRTRSNAAILLSFLGVEAAEERIARALHDTANNTKAAFCHIAYALSAMNRDPGATALKSFLRHDEPWFRVDAVGALARYSEQQYIIEIAEALLDFQPLYDYACVVASRGIKPADFLKHPHSVVQDAGCVMVSGLLDAARQTFNAEVLDQAELAQCLRILEESSSQDESPLRVRARKRLQQWSEGENIDAIEADDVTRLAETITESLNKYGDRADMRYWSAVKLAGECRLTSLNAVLLSELEKNNFFADTIIEAIGKIGEPSAADPLIKLASSKVDLKERIGRQLSKQPIVETDQEKAKIYWSILKALGHIHALSAIPFLTQACDDYAPDKREQALSALIKQGGAPGVTSEQLDRIKLQVLNSLNDPSASVRAAALVGIADLQMIQTVELVLDMVDSREASLSRQAGITFKALRNGPHSEKASAALAQKIEKESDSHRKRKLEEL